MALVPPAFLASACQGLLDAAWIAQRAAFLAQENGAAPPAGGKEAAPDGGFLGPLSQMGFLLPMLVIGVLFYFLMLQPERKKQAEQKKMLADLKKSDRVVTVGGIVGVVSNLSDKYVTLRVDENSNTKIQVLRSSVSRVVTGDETAEEKAT